MKPRRFLGDLDAASDQRFEQHFVESDELRSILTNRSDIIYGSKGVGKTALCRAISELLGDNYFATKTISLDQLSFEQVHQALSELKRCSSSEIPALARNTWRNVLTLYGLEALAEALGSDRPLRARIRRTLEEEGFYGVSSDSTNRLLFHISQLLTRIASIGLEEDTAPHEIPKIPENTVDLTIRTRMVVNEYPSNASVRPILEEATKIVSDSQRILVCLDGFDSIVDHTPESRTAIFAGLIDAIHKCSRDPLISRVFCFKAFLPQELTNQAHAIVWDADKFINNSHYLNWSSEEFQRFLRQRMLPYAKTKSKDFFDVWSDFMPTKVANDPHRIEENSFAYILRHTLYRPRQVLAHVQRILDEWDVRSDNFRVDPTFIPHVVAKTNRELAQSVVYQLGITYPNLDSFMRSWSGMSNVILGSDFLARVRKIFDCASTEEKELVDAMFTFGLFGLARKGTLIKGASQARFRFSYVGQSNAPTHGALDGSDLVAVSPMLHEYCGCTPSEYGPITPI